MEIKMWEDYTPQEKDFLRERWELGGVDSVAEVLKDWHHLPWLDSLSYKQNTYRLSSLFTTLAGNFTIVPLKEWKEYTNTEKDILRMRWTKEKINAVVKALKERRSMPEFITRLDLHTELSYDLRRIDLYNHNLDTVYLVSTYLQGAYLFETSLQDANLKLAKLQGADLIRAKLQDAALSAAGLQDAYLSYANLEGAYLGSAKLQDAELYDANLQGAVLYRADLQGAILYQANLHNTNLIGAKLQGADLQGANLQDADLYTARFDSTYLWQVNLEVAKNIRYIIWGDTLKNRYIIGEEGWADYTKNDKDFQEAEITYRDLKTFYKKELMDDVAAEFHYRENEIITKSSPWFVRQLRTVFLKWTYGYGSKPIRLLWRSLDIIIGTTVIFLLSTFLANLGFLKFGIVKSKKSGRERFLPFCNGLIIVECLYFSLLSFTTFGYGAIKPKQWLQLFILNPVEYKPIGVARIFVGIEAALGIWIFALLVTVLFGK